ncbi:MAG: hypothetical protein Fur009_8430 [Candidatus Microgenomates bacterium]
MKITVYTITDCQFSKQEKEYLKAHNLAYEEKNLETNKDFLTEMLAVSNNFAGTPVTRVEKDDGTIRVFKGFTKEEFDEFFGFVNEQPTTLNQTAEPTTQQTDNQSIEPTQTTNPSPTQDQPTQAQPTQPPQPEPTSVDPQLNTVLDQLQQKVQPTDQPTEPSIDQTPDQTPPPSPISNDSTNLTDPNPPTSNTPSIPDFPKNE